MSIKKVVPTKDGRQYVFSVRYKDIYQNSKQYTSQRFKTRKEAELEEARFKVKISEKKINTSNVTFDQVFTSYIEYKKDKIKLQTVNKVKNLYIKLEPLYNVKVNNFNITMYNEFRKYLDEFNLSVVYKNKIQNLLKSLLTYSNKYYNTSLTMVNYIEPYKDVNKLKKEMQFFTYDEFQKFISVIDEFNYKTFFEVLYFLGLRQGEATALTWNDINFTKKEVNINKTLTTKLKGQLYTVSSPKTVKSNRTLPIPSKLLKSLEKLKEEAKKKKYYTDNWFVFGDELPFKESTIQRKKNTYCEKAGVKQIRIHDFRHSCASFLIQHGASIVLVSKYLGHSKISVTLDIYTHLYQNELLEVSKMIDTI